MPVRHSPADGAPARRFLRPVLLVVAILGAAAALAQSAPPVSIAASDVPKDLMIRMTGGPLPEAHTPALIDDYIAHYRAHIADASVPFSGVKATLAAFVEAGARLGVLTNKPEELTVPLLATLGLAPFFTAIHGAGRYS